MSASEIREAYLSFFERQGHRRVPSDSLLPSNDPSLLFTSAGMVQFKPLYVAKERPYTRATSCQRCLRTSDIEQVGQTGRHLTFFEMLGNFSFGDYFKESTIAYAWEFLTKVLRLDPKLLQVSVFEQDDEAARLWRKFVSPDRIVEFGDEDNYWPPGSALKTWSGPNGPCSEIFYDFGPQYCGFSPACSRPGEHECERFREIWNLVFPQFIRNQAGDNPAMAAPGIDTGLGLERLAAVMQQKGSIFETDLFEPIMMQARELMRITDGRNRAEVTRATRIVADHVRAAAFMISDGILPSNEGRGYVLRRLIRRAVRQTALFGEPNPVVSALLPVVVRQMGQAYPEIQERERDIHGTLAAEEQRFIETLQRGLEELNKERAAARGPLSGERAFFFYDTFGFPRELTEDIWVREMRLPLSAGFETEYGKALLAQQERARAAWKGPGGRVLTDLHHALAQELGATPFMGYQTLAGTASTRGLIKLAEGGGEGLRAKEAKAGETVEVILDQTPFYAESGGQVGDRGRLVYPGGQAEVLDVKKPLGGMFIHTVRILQGTLTEGLEVRMEVDAPRRAATQRHHTATHLLHAALHRIVGRQATQAGSLVAPERLRFDFMSAKALDGEKLRAIESMVNGKILENVPVVTQETTLVEAKRRGAQALFGEKYGDQVRMVEIAGFSLELCGGTHVDATGAIGPFVVVAESAVASGVRRVEALAGDAALTFLSGQREKLERLAALLKCASQDVELRITRLLEERRELQNTIDRMKGQQAQQELAGQLAGATELHGVNVLITEALVEDPGALRTLADQALDKLREGVAVIGSRGPDKWYLIARVSKALAKRVDAGELVKAAAAAAGGTGGGKPEMAQAGGKDPAKLPVGLQKAREFLDARLGGS